MGKLAPHTCPSCRTMLDINCCFFLASSALTCGSSHPGGGIATPKILALNNLGSALRKAFRIIVSCRMDAGWSATVNKQSFSLLSAKSRRSCCRSQAWVCGCFIGREWIGCVGNGAEKCA